MSQNKYIININIPKYPLGRHRDKSSRIRYDDAVLLKALFYWWVIIMNGIT